MYTLDLGPAKCAPPQEGAEEQADGVCVLVSHTWVSMGEERRACRALPLSPAPVWCGWSAATLRDAVGDGAPCLSAVLGAGYSSKGAKSEFSSKKSHFHG